jgi:hypothetical protein
LSFGGAINLSWNLCGDGVAGVVVKIEEGVGCWKDGDGGCLGRLFFKKGQGI